MRVGVVGTPWRHLTYVELVTDDGVTGVGETRMINDTAALLGYLDEIKSTHVLGRDPFAIEALELWRRFEADDVIPCEIPI